MLYRTKYYGFVEVSEPIYRYLTRNDAQMQHRLLDYFPRTTKNKTDMLPRLISYEMMLEEFGFDVPDQEIFSSPVLIAEKRELYRELNSAVNLLNEQQRAIIRKIFFYEESQAQISALLCVSEATVSRLKRAALTVLREILS